MKNIKEFDLENYTPKGQLEGFPKEIIARMLECQEEQGNKKDIEVFEKMMNAGTDRKGFFWMDTKEGFEFWAQVINNKNFDIFFEKYPKKDYLENYIPKGELESFPKEIIARMLECQEEQGNPRDISVFEKRVNAKQCIKGFDWGDTQEDWGFWHEVITNKNFDLFFGRYPKKEEVTAKYTQVDNNVILSDTTYTQSSVEINTTEDIYQEFKVGDEVIDFISGRRGRVFQIYASNDFPIFVKFNDEQVASFTFDGKFYVADKYPRLLHYRDDYNYDVIDFNNLPKRQKHKKWRAKVGETYYIITSNFEIENYCEENEVIDDEAYNSGNYFQTKKEAEEVADKLNTYFKQLILEQKKEEIKSNVNQEAK